jgi:hypothetical protein
MVIVMKNKNFDLGVSIQHDTKSPNLDLIANLPIKRTHTMYGARSKKRK